MHALAIADTGTWSLGVLVGLPILTIVLLTLTVVGVWLIRHDKHVSSYDRGFPKGFGIAALVVAGVLLVLALTPSGYYPFSAEYHQWRETSGTVAKVDTRLISDGDKGMSDKFVVRFTSDGQQFGCDDTRCAGIDVGDTLTLSCKRAWQYTGTDGYDCRFVSTAPAR